MTGRTLNLTPSQREELLQYAEGPRRLLPGAYPQNLVRRGLLDSARSTHGPGYYRITSAGRAALAAYAEQQGPRAIRASEICGRDDWRAAPIFAEDARCRIYGRRGRVVTIRASELRDRDDWRAGPILAENAIYPRDEEHRYRIYGRRGEELKVLACAGSPEALGVALVQLDEDEKEQGLRLVDLGAIGILDAVAGRWIILPWHRPDPGRRSDPSREERNEHT